MLLLRACRVVLVGSVLTALCCSLGEAQQKAPAGRAKVKSEPTNGVPVKRASQEEAAPATRPQKSVRETRPEPKEFRVEPLPPELEKILKDWETASAKINTLSGEHKRIVSNSVFEVEKWAQGQFFYESPDHGRIDLEAFPLKKGQRANKENTAREPYRLEADQPTKWICTGKAVLNIVDKEKTYEMFELPEEMQGKNIIHGPLPFLFGMKAEEAKRRFELSFVDPKKNTKDVALIRAKPRQVMDRDNFQEALIKLDITRYLPIAVKLIDPSGNVETVYTFDKLVVNELNLVPEIFRKDPFKPKLAGYKRIMPPDMTQPDQIQIAAPSEGKGRKSSNIQQTKDEQLEETPRDFKKTANGQQPGSSTKNKKPQK